MLVQVIQLAQNGHSDDVSVNNDNDYDINKAANDFKVEIDLTATVIKKNNETYNNAVEIRLIDTEPNSNQLKTSNP